MPRMLAAVVLLGLLVTGAASEPVYLIWREPTASGSLAYTTVYWCVGTACSNWGDRPPSRCASDDEQGGDAKKIILHVPVVQGTLPVTVRLKVTATDTYQNETPGVIVTHTFIAE